MDEEEMIIAKPGEYHDFIPTLKGKKVIIRVVSGAQPITGTIEAYNPYEIHLQRLGGKFTVLNKIVATAHFIRH